jgi:hypothetical protein
VKRFPRERPERVHFRVAREGERRTRGSDRAAGAATTCGLTVADVIALYVTETPDEGLLRRAIDHPALPAAWRDYFQSPARSGAEIHDDALRRELPVVVEAVERHVGKLNVAVRRRESEELADVLPAESSLDHDSPRPVKCSASGTMRRPANAPGAAENPM